MVKRVPRLLTLIILVVLVSSPAFSAQAESVAYQEDFEGGQAQGWTLDPGWSVILDGSNHVLAGQGHSWATSPQSFDGDMRLSFRVKRLRGRIHLVVRLTDASRYFIGFDANGSDLNKQYFPEEFHYDLAGDSTPHSPDRWYQVEIVLQGSTIEFLVDGVQQWSYTDPQPLTGGAFAFETQADSQAYVDDIVVELGSTQPSTAPASTTSAPPASSSLSWVRTGGPLGGLGYDIRMRPDNPDFMFVTDAWAGVFASRDGGQNWFPSNDGITIRTGSSGDAIPVFSLTIDPNDPDIVWAGTQFERGIFKSTDGGHTWIEMDKGVLESDGITFRGFSIQPGDSNVVYAAAEISSWAWTPNHQEKIGREFDLTSGVVYKTTDGGQSWKTVWRGENLARYILINPQNTDVLYISTGIFDREAASSDPVAGEPGGEGVLKSTDAGRTWTHVNNGLGNLYVGSLFMHPTNPNILLAGTGNNVYDAGSGVYLSLDGGNRWTQTLANVMEITSVEIATSNPNIAYAGSRSAVYRSEDGGRNWQQMTKEGTPWGSPGVQTGFPIDFQVDPRNPDRIFTNAYGGGAFLSEDGGRTWQDASKGYTGAQVRDLSVDPTAPSRIIAAARSGLFTSYDGGSNWEGINPANIDSIEWNAVTFDPSNPQHLIGGLNVHGLLVGSTDGGTTWETLEGPHEDRIGWRAIAFAPSDPKVVYAGSAGFYSAGSFDLAQPGIGVYVSGDNGDSWSPANDHLTQAAHVTSLAVDPTDASAVFAATANRGLVKSADGGQSWSQIGGGLSASKPILSVAIQTDDPNVIFVGLDRGAIFRSTDGGQTWKRSASGLNPEASVSDIVFDPTSPEDILYLADLQSGVYRSTDGGGTWMAINNGLASRSINALALSSDGLHLYAAVEGGGIYRLDLSGQPPASAAAPVQIPTVALPATPSSLSVSTPESKPPIAKLPCLGAFVLPLISLGLIGSILAKQTARKEKR